MRTLARKIDWHHLVIQGTLFLGVGALWSYGAVLMLSRGLSNSAVGIVTCVAQLLPMVLQPVTRRACDRFAAMTPRRMILLVSALAIAVLLITCAAPLSLPLVIVSFITVALVLNLIIPLVNIIIVSYILRGVDLNYGFGRSAGSFGYAASSAVLGFLLEGRDPILIVPFIVVSLALQMVAVYTFRYPLPALPEKTGEVPWEEGAVTPLGRRRDFVLMVLALSLMIGAHNVTNVYMVHVVYRVGGAEALLGVVIGFSSCMEVFGMPFCRRLRGRWGIAAVMRLSALFFVLRLLVLLVAPNPAVLLAASLLQAVQCGLMLPAVVYYVADTLPPQLQSRGQSVVHLFNNCLAPALISLAVGVVVDGKGINTALAMMLCLAALGAVLVFVTTKNLRKKEAEQ